MIDDSRLCYDDAMANASVVRELVVRERSFGNTQVVSVKQSCCESPPEEGRFPVLLKMTIGSWNDNLYFITLTIM